MRLAVSTKYARNGRNWRRSSPATIKDSLKRYSHTPHSIHGYPRNLSHAEQEFAILWRGIVCDHFSDDSGLQELKILQTLVSATKTRKPKFAFNKSKSATKPSSSTVEFIPSTAPVAIPSSALPNTPSKTPPASATHRLKDRADSFLSLADLDLSDDAEQAGCGSLVLSNLSGCFVDLAASSPSRSESQSTTSKGFEAIYLYTLENTVVLLPDANNGSIMIHGCIGCRFILAAHQVSRSRLCSEIGADTL